MNKRVHLVLLSILTTVGTLSAQEKYGKAFNLGVGATYYGYVGYAAPVIMLNYEIDVAKNFTLAPFLGVFSYGRDYYWYGPGPGPKPHPKPPYPPDAYYYRYHYRQTVVPFGVKGTYYFDELLKANKKWDFYASVSLGFAIRSTHWEDGYYEGYDDYRRSSVYADLHIGTEYHLNNTFGLFADASLGMLLLGLSVHHH